ncbi:hypothetical protein GCM10011345_34380 [Gemmobacter megaterium]|nr:hypothetical protein GCM10011345_34380 [Gemmobacter megaterium]
MLTALSSYSLAAIANVENLTGQSGAGQVLGGNILDNVITGAWGNDSLYGGQGNDTLIGGAGNDLLNGGPGADTFVFAPGFGQDTVVGFNAGLAGDQDVLAISSSLFGNFAAVMAATANVGAHAVITVNASTSITLLNVQRADLVADDFLFI